MDEKLSQGEDFVGMTDNQSRRFEELIRENETLQGKWRNANSEGMTDFQFTEYQKVCAERDALCEANRALQRNAPECDDGMTDFQYKNTIEMIYQILKANFEAGKTPDEILTIIAALKNESNN